MTLATHGKDEPLSRMLLTYLLVAACIIQWLSVWYYWSFFSENGYLPSPFIYNKFDTFMDLYNSMWWGNDDGKYTVWGSIYPPINFLFLKILSFVSFGGSQMASSLEMRDVAIAPGVFLVVLHLLAPAAVVASKAWSGFSRPQRFLAFLFAIVSPPFLFSMERGNLIILAVFFLPFMFSDRFWIRALAIAFLINLKPYFAVMLLTYPLQGRFDRFVVVTAFSGALFIFTGLLDDQNFAVFLTNIVSFSQNEALLSGREILAFPSSISAFSYVINIASRNAAEIGYPLDFFTAAATSIEIIKLSGLAAFFGALAFSARLMREEDLLALMVIPIVNLGIWVGGYSQIFYLAVVPVLWSTRLRWIHLTLVILIFAPFDLLTLRVDNLGPAFSFLSQQIVDLNWQLSAGTFFRPAANFALLITCAIEFLLVATNADRRTAISSKGRLVST